MKFFSKQNNLNIILRSGIPGNKQLGTQSIPGVHVRFEGGMADIRRPMGGMSVEEIVERLKSHERYGIDFIPDESESNNDPFAGKRTEIEPAHVMTEIKYGHVEGKISTPQPVKFTSEQLELVKKMVAEGAEIAILAYKDSVVPLDKYEPKEVQREEIKEPSIEDVSPLDDYSKMAPAPLPDESGMFIDETVEPIATPVIERKEVTSIPSIPSEETPEVIIKKKPGRPSQNK